MKFSGALSDAAGKPLSGAVDVTFSLYNTEAGGDALWFETQSVQADELGRYTALLGAMHTDGLPVDLFTSGEVRWLGIQVGTEPEQQPRVLLVSVPYALKAGDAETLGGKPASAFMLASTAEATSAASAGTISGLVSAAGVNAPTTQKGKPTPEAITSGGTTNYIAGWFNSTTLGTSAIYQDPTTNNIGIGTTSPVDLLSVEGPANTGLSVYGGGNQQGGFRWNPGNGGYIFVEDPAVSNPVEIVGSGLSYINGGHFSLGSSTDVSPLQVTGASGASAGAAGNGIEELSTGTGLSTDNRLQFGIVDGSYGWIQS
ncbi:MAG TPA: hypothetical protein VG167_20945, partial [Verrucomicrobiae bacterium]|nr:hypothetical protein [Verrucomicrobiae bacterium]